MAHSQEYNTIFIDTEGMLGISQNENRRTRLLLKVLAISDIVIYRTRAERLHNDLFTFLGDASEAYWKYFTPELKAASERCKMQVPLSTLGPSVIIFHETQHTELLGEGVDKTHVPKVDSSKVRDYEPKLSVEHIKEGASEGQSQIAVLESTIAELDVHDSAHGGHDSFVEVISLQQGEDKGGKSPVSSHLPTSTLPYSHPMSAEELLRIR